MNLIQQVRNEDLHLKHPDKSVSAEGLHPASLHILAEIPHFPTTSSTAQMTRCATIWDARLAGYLSVYTQNWEDQIQTKLSERFPLQSCSERSRRFGKSAGCWSCPTSIFSIKPSTYCTFDCLHFYSYTLVVISALFLLETWICPSAAVIKDCDRHPGVFKPAAEIFQQIL